MKIEVNNGRYIEITENFVTNYGSNGEIERRDYFSDGEIVMALNLLRYMKDYDMKSAYLFDASTRHYLRNLIDNGDVEEMRIFQ